VIVHVRRNRESLAQIAVGHHRDGRLHMRRPTSVCVFVFWRTSSDQPELWHGFGDSCAAADIEKATMKNEDVKTAFSKTLVESAF
jgi:hypothetical protein